LKEYRGGVEGETQERGAVSYGKRSFGCRIRRSEEQGKPGDLTRSPRRYRDVIYFSCDFTRASHEGHHP
jgi:hypothetical protein